MKTNGKRWIVLFILTLVLSACSDFESGVLAIVKPTPGQNFYEEFSGISLPVDVVVSSTFEASKQASIWLDENEVGNCLIGPQASEQPCVTLYLDVPGEYKIVLRTTRRDGSVVETSTYVQWTPYTSLDKVMWYLSFNDSPVWGYVVAYLILMVFLSFVLWIVLRNEHQVATIVAVVTAILMVALFFAPSVGPSLWAICWLVPGLFLSIGLAAWWRHFPLRPPLVVRRRDGTELHYGTRSRRPDKPVRIDVTEIQSDFEVSDRTKSEEE